jgi:hypothetical protein
MRNKRPSLAERMQSVARPDPAPLGPNREHGFHAATREGKKKVTILLEPAAHKQFRQLALDLDRSGEALLLEAIGLLFEKYGRPPLG